VYHGFCQYGSQSSSNPRSVILIYSYIYPTLDYYHAVDDETMHGKRMLKLYKEERAIFRANYLLLKERSRRILPPLRGR
jgi:hypothetical protein